MPEEVPPPVQKQWVPGEITIVEVTDFECPHCKKADAVLREVLSRHPAPLRVVRLVSPMPSHENGVPAARAYIAAREQGKADAMAAALFASDDRAPARCREIAERLGLDMARDHRTLNTDDTSEEYHHNQTWVVRATGHGVPLIWVQKQFFKGVPTVEALEEAIAKARPF